jgi:hypothetical protein
MAGPVGILGSIVFVGGLGTTFTFHSLGKKRRNAFAKHKIINGNDLIEDVGFNPIELDLACRFYSPWTADPSLRLIALEALEDAKIPVPLIISGTPVGRGALTLWVVEEITAKMPKFRGGVLTVLDVDIKLLEYSNVLSISGPLSPLLQAGISAAGNLIG